MGLGPFSRLGLLLLAIVLAINPQIFVHGEQLSCNQTQYLHRELQRCCNRCPPGHYVKNECTPSSETVCQPCKTRTFTTQWNYASTCRLCYSCGKSLVERQPCNATQNTVCDCPEGYSCNQPTGLKCDSCTLSHSTVATKSEPSERQLDIKNIWIIIGVLLFMVVAAVVFICLKFPLLKSFGQMVKNKSSSESTPQPETGVGIAVVVHDGPASPLLKHVPIKTPSQEVGKDLHFPVQVSDETEIGEISLIAK